MPRGQSLAKVVIAEISGYKGIAAQPMRSRGRTIAIVRLALIDLRRFFTLPIPIDLLRMYVRESDVVARLVEEAKRLGWVDDFLELYQVEYERRDLNLQWTCHRAGIRNTRELDQACVAHYNKALKFFGALSSQAKVAYVDNLWIAEPVLITEFTVLVSHLDCFSARLLMNRAYAHKEFQRGVFAIAEQVQT